MKKKYPISILILLFSFYVGFGQTVIYSEDFTGQNGLGAWGNNIDLTGASWSIDVSGTTLDNAQDHFRIRNAAQEFLQGRDLDGPAIWFSPVVNISGFNNVQFSLDASERGDHEQNQDSFITEYSINGGAWIVASNNGNLGGDFNNTVVSDVGLFGNTMQLRVTMVNTADDERYRLDNIVIEGTPLPDPCSELFISEYVSGFLFGNNVFNAFVEIYNPSNSPIDLGNYDLDIYNNGSPTPVRRINLTGIIQPYDVFIIRSTRTSNVFGGNPAAVGVDLIAGNLEFTGDDTIVLTNAGALIDVIGQIGVDPGTEWTGTVCTTGTANGGLRRNSSIQMGDTDGTNVFNPDDEWTCFDRDDFTNLGTHENDCAPELQLQYPIATDVVCGFTNDFGAIIIGSDSDRVVRIENAGVADLEVSNLTFGTGANFSLVSAPTFPFTIGGGGFQDITIRFSPDAVSLFSDTLTIVNTDADEGSCTIILEGEGVLCNAVTEWDGSNWDNGAPDASTTAIINGNYTTSSGSATSFTACSLVVNADLTISNGDFIEVINDVTVNSGSITTNTHGSFVQRGNGVLAGSFNLNGGDAFVNKSTATLLTTADYTYWSSPVDSPLISNALAQSNPNRRYTFNASNYLDADGDSIDDAGNDWVAVAGTDTMEPGKGYISMHGDFTLPLPRPYSYIFNGIYNTGDITTPVFYNSANIAYHWHLLGNPYPSAIDADEFFMTNSGVVDQLIYMWSQVSPADAANPGNEVLNFNQNDYITINSMSSAGTGTTAAPNRRVPSGQGFFISTSADNQGTGGVVTFTNNMRVSGPNVNNEFFRTSNQNTTPIDDDIERLWINLSSEVGIYSQISVAYADIATDGFDGNSIDTFRRYAGNAGLLYSLDNQGDGFYVIQGKAKSSLNLDETIKLGFGAYISTRETYTLDAIQKEGDFLENNTMYLRDNYEGTLHDLTASAYTFESDGGSFDDRFEIVFSNNLLSVDDTIIEDTSLSIIELNDENVQFTIKNTSLTIDTIRIFDIQGRLVYNFEGNNSTEVYNLSNLSSSVYIVKVTLSNGQILTKKAIKK